MSDRNPRYDLCECGARKLKTSDTCQDCNYAGRRRDGFPAGGSEPGVYSEDSVWTVSRRESIMTFTRGDERRSLHCIGQGIEAQEADGRRQLEGEGWVMECRSTPQSILVDLRRQAA